MRLADYLLRLNVDRYDSIAWIDRNHDGSIARAWTWIEVQRLIAAAGTFCLEHSVGKGDRVVNFGRNSLAWAILDLACSAINAVHVPIDGRFSTAQQKHCLDLVKPKLVFADGPIASGPIASGWSRLGQLTSLLPTDQTLQQIALPFSPDDLANILFTSGTTGVQKGVMLSHKNLHSNALAKLDAMPQNHHDRRLNFLPFSHAYARTCELTTWLISSSCMEVASSMENVFSSAAFSAPTLLNGVPVFFETLEKKFMQMQGTQACVRELLGGQVRRLASGGATLPNSVRARFAAIGLPIYQGYGLTESSPVICSNRSGQSDMGEKECDVNLVEVGPPVKGMKVRIDESGRLWVAGDGVMLGYWQDTEGTKAKIVNGWLETGDLAEYVENTNCVEPSAIKILGRADDTLVLSSGYKVQPLPIEQMVLAESWVSRCILVGTMLPFPILIVRALEADYPPMLPNEMLARIEKILHEFPRYAIPCKVIIAEEEWTKGNGLLNFKGGLVRKKIESRYQAQISETIH